MGLSGHVGNFIASCSFGGMWGILLLPVLLEARGDFVASCSFGGTWAILLLLVLLKAFFGRQFSWWEVTFFLTSFLLVLLVDCYMVHCPSFASFA
jgi:hypothetical protein